MGELAKLFQTGLPDIELVLAERARRSLHEYYRQMWRVVEPDTPFLDNWHIGAIAEHLQAQTMGQIEKLLINIPFRQGKSLEVCVAWPSWEWIDHPSTRWLMISYAAELSRRDSLKCRDVIQSAWYQRRWGHRYQLSEDQNTKGRYENSKRGLRVSTSFVGLATGEGGNRIVMDDPHNMKEIHSDTIRKETIRVWKEALSSRRNNPLRDTFTLIMQRGHERDLSGYLLAEEDGWTHLCLPMEYEPKRFVHFKLPDGKRVQKEMPVKSIKTKIGFVDPRTKEGELLHPKRFPKAVVADMKVSLGSYGASGQLQQRPSPGEGGIFRRAHWKFYKELPQLDEIVLSVDAAFKDLKTSDFVAVQAWGRAGARKYLLKGRVCDRLGFGATCDTVRVVRAAQPKAAIAVLVEDKANGSAVIETLRKELPGILAIEPEGGKVARAFAIQPDHEAGNIYLPDPSIDPTINDFIELCGAFPNVAHDDEVDAFTQVINWFRNRAGAQGLLDHMRSMYQEQEAKKEEQRKKNEQAQSNARSALMGQR